MAGTLSSPSRTSIGTISSRQQLRGGQYVGRPVVTAISRPPILMEFTDTSLQWGLVGDAKPKHVLPYSHNSNNNSNIMMLFGSAASNSGNSNSDSDGEIIYMRQTSVSVGTWYRTLSPLLQHVYHSLGPDGKERRVIVLLPPHIAIPSSSSDNNNCTCLLPTNFKTALLQCLLHNNNNNNAASANNNNNISVSLQSSITLVPYALPMISTAMLLIHVGGDNNNNNSGDISCMIHAAGHSLPFTFQTILGNSTSNNNINTTTDINIMDDDDDDDEQLCIILLAVLKCIQACPRAARKEAIQNIVFCGQGVIHRPEFPLQLVRRLQQVLRRQSFSTTDDTATATATTAVSAKPKQEQEPQEQEQDEEDDEPKRNRMKIHHGFGIVPVNLKELQPLAEHVGLVDYVVYSSPREDEQGRRRPRPDLLAWTGASLWAWHWHNHAQNDAQFHWIGK